MESPSEIDIITVEETAVTASLDVQIREFLVSNFPHWSAVFAKYRQWHRLSPLFTVLAAAVNPSSSLESPPLVGHTAVVIRSITTTWNFRYEVASFQGVSVAAEYRRHGVAKKILERSLDECRHRGYRFAILFCTEPLVEYYQWQNWKLADDSMVMWNNRDLPIAMRSNCPMYYELTDEPFPEGPIDVHSF